MTPEGKVKKLVRQALAVYGPALYSYWPVPTGYGKRTLDVLCIFRGVGFAVETKAPGEKLTPKQEETAAEIQAAGGAVFVVHDPAEVGALVGYLQGIEIRYQIIQKKIAENV